MKKYYLLTVLIFNFSFWAIAQNTSYVYDKAGNLKTAIYRSTTTTYKYDSNSNRLSNQVTQNVLPVYLISFMATKQQTNVLLTWDVTQEINFAKYDVQFAIDGINFKTFSSVTAKGFDKMDYSVIHCCPILGNNYYRLKLEDKDGKFAYSEIRKVLFESSNSFIIYPNPISDKANLTILFENPIIGNADVYVYNTMGSKVLATTFAPGQSIYQLNGASLAAGTYFVIVNTKDKLYQSKFIKQ